MLFFDSVDVPKFKGGTLIKWLISTLSNLAQTFHSSAKLKNKQVVKIRSLNLNKQKFGTTMQQWLSVRLCFSTKSSAMIFVKKSQQKFIKQQFSSSSVQI